MSLEQWAYVAQIVGVVLLIASVAYVGVQVRQNTKAQHSASRQATLAAELEVLSWCIDYPEDTIGLGSASGEVRPTIYLIAFLRTREFAWYQYRNGILDQTTWESYLAPTSLIFQSDFAKRLWASDFIKLDAGFRAEIDKVIGLAS